MSTCRVCGSTEFYVESGLSHCQECETLFEGHGHTEDVGEEEGGYGDASTRFDSALKPIHKQVKKSNVSSSQYPTRAWLTSEAFNIILCSQVKAFINLGVSPKLKPIVLQMWSSYLRFNEICFQSNVSDNSQLSALGCFPRSRDIQVLCGATKISLKRKKKGKKRKQLCEPPIEQSEQIDIENGVEKSGNHSTCNDASQDSEVNDVESNNGHNASQDSEVNDVENNNGHKASQDIEVSSDPVAFNGADQCSNKNESNELNMFPVRRKRDCPRSLFYKQEKRQNGKPTNKRTRVFLPDYMTLPKTLCFCYLGLLVLEDRLLLSDIMRFASEGQIPYMDAIHCLPPDMRLQLSDHLMLSPSGPLNMKRLILFSTKIAKFIQLPELKHPPLLPIATRFVKALNLPTNLMCHVKLLMHQDTTPRYWCPIANEASSKILPYEVEAVAYILITLKLLFGLNGKHEKKHSNLVRKINSLVPDAHLFVWDDWFCTMKLRMKFLESQNTSFSNLCNINDVEKLASHYDIVMRKWSSKERSNLPLLAYKQDFRNSLRGIFSEYLPPRNMMCDSEPTSFPLLANMKKGISFAGHSYQYQYSSSSHFQWDAIARDFSSASVCYSLFHSKKTLSIPDSAKSVYLKLQKKFYFGSRNSSSVVIQPPTENSSSAYWFLDSTKSGVLDSYHSLPNIFKWLLSFTSSLIECTVHDLYFEVLQIEKRIFKR